MMVSIASPMSDSLNLVLCYYVNTTATLQMSCISGAAEAHSKRVIFPHQRLLFEAPLKATLEIQTCSSSGETHVVHIPCAQLQVNQRVFLHENIPNSLFDPPTSINLGEE
jgi:hypothetical protein